LLHCSQSHLPGAVMNRLLDGCIAARRGVIPASASAADRVKAIA